MGRSDCLAINLTRIIPEADEYDPHKDPAEGIGELSLDENKEVS
jgi:hypothetical protein